MNGPSCLQATRIHGLPRFKPRDITALSNHHLTYVINDTCSAELILFLFKWQPCAFVPSTFVTDHADHVTAHPILYEATQRNGSHMLQAIDRSTGVIFERVYHGGQRTSDSVLALGSSSDLSFHIVPSTLFPATRPPFCTEAHAVRRPAMILTVPTPALPQSPVFVPQSPITVSKFFEALEPEASEHLTEAASSSGLQAPSLASCGECGLFEFEQGSQCRDCDRRWLACKVWYRAQDGGRRRWLSVPYIRPAESNAQNRALMHGLGVPGCEAGDGAVTAKRNDPVPVRAWKRLRRVRRFFRSKAVHVQGLLPNVQFATTKGNIELSTGVTAVLRPMRRTVKTTAAALRLEFLWGKISGAGRPRGCENDVPKTHDDAGRCFTKPSTPSTVLHDSTSTQYLGCGNGGVGAS